MKYRLYKFRDGKKQQWLEWCVFLIEHENEVIETLVQEQCKREACWYEGDSVFYGMDSLFLKADDRQINLDHRKNVRECLSYVSEYTQSIPEAAISLFDFRSNI